MARDAGNVVMVGVAISGLAFVASSEGRHSRVARLLGAAGRIRRDAGGGPVPGIMRQLGDPEGDARRALGDEAFGRALAEGSSMDMDEAVSYASVDAKDDETSTSG